jgi:uncharacterized coiled-coil protein SlyX
MQNMQKVTFNSKARFEAFEVKEAKQGELIRAYNELVNARKQELKNA